MVLVEVSQGSDVLAAALGPAPVPVLSRTLTVGEQDLLVLQAQVGVSACEGDDPVDVDASLTCDGVVASPISRRTLWSAGVTASPFWLTGTCQPAPGASTVEVQLVAEASSCGTVIAASGQTFLDVSRYRSLSFDPAPPYWSPSTLDFSNFVAPVEQIMLPNQDCEPGDDPAHLCPVHSVSVASHAGDYVYATASMRAIWLFDAAPEVGVRLEVGGVPRALMTENLLADTISETSMQVYATTAVDSAVQVQTHALAEDADNAYGISYLVANDALLRGMILRAAEPEGALLLREVRTVARTHDRGLRSDDRRVDLHPEPIEVSFARPGLLHTEAFASTEFDATRWNSECDLQIEVARPNGLEHQSPTGARQLNDPYRYNHLRAEDLYWVEEPGVYVLRPFLSCFSSEDDTGTLLADGTHTYIQVFEAAAD